MVASAITAMPYSRAVTTRPPEWTTRYPAAIAGTPRPRYDTTYSSDSTPARSCGATSGNTVRMPPWNPLPKPIPAITVPAKKPTVEPAATATSVDATPSTRARMPVSISVRAAAPRSTTTDSAAEPASTNRLRPPSTIECESARLRTSAGPSDA